MKKFKMTFILIFYLNQIIFAQLDNPFNKGFKVGFQEGYCYNHNTVDCLTPLVPLPPLPRLNERNDSYTDGYNRGFQTGLDLKRLQTGLGTVNGVAFESIPNYRFNDYIPQNPVDAMVKVGMYKQKLFDIRSKWIQQRINDLGDFNYILLKQLSPDYFDSYNKSLNDFIETKLNGQRVDCSDNYVFNQVVNIFNTHERNIYNTYQSLIIEANSITVTETEFFQNNVIGTAQIDSTLSPIVKDRYNNQLPSSDFKTFKITKHTNTSTNDEEIAFLYSKTNNSYWSFSITEISQLHSASYIPMNFIGSSNAISIPSNSNGLWLFDQGINIKNISNEGVTTYRTLNNNYSQFQIFKDSDTNKRYFIPKSIYDNGLYYTAYPIFSN
jgi:hypothetical protein